MLQVALKGYAVFKVVLIDKAIIGKEFKLNSFAFIFFLYTYKVTDRNNSCSLTNINIS